jgi:hypothetical protein
VLWIGSNDRVVLRMALRRSREAAGRITSYDAALDIRLTMELLDRYDALERRLDSDTPLELDRVDRRLVLSSLRELIVSTRVRSRFAEQDVRPALEAIVATAETLVLTLTAGRE